MPVSSNQASCRSRAVAAAALLAFAPSCARSHAGTAGAPPPTVAPTAVERAAVEPGRTDGPVQAPGTVVSPPAAPAPAPIAILFVGDGMGKAQLAAASCYRHGDPRSLFVQSLPIHADVRTGSLGGITDSAASATAMASGVRTYNQRLGVDRDGAPAPSVFEHARSLGQLSAAVTTTYVSHATPAAFSAHADRRYDYDAIAAQQARVTRPDILIGGGRRYFEARGDDGNTHLEALRLAGYAVATDPSAWRGVPVTEHRLAALLVSSDMAYTTESDNAAEPTLAEMALDAVRRLEDAGRGGVVLVEGARIDMACHDQLLREAIGETLEFDDAVRAVEDWRGGREHISVIVTADHETGGLRLEPGCMRDELPTVTWRWKNHTNARVDLYATETGPNASVDGQTINHLHTFELMRAHLEGRELSEPARVIVPDGGLDDLSGVASSPIALPGQPLAVRAGADTWGLGVGVAGQFAAEDEAVVVYVDLDPDQEDARPGTFDGDGSSAGSALSRIREPFVGSSFQPDLAVISSEGDDIKFEHSTGGAGAFLLRDGRTRRIAAPVNFAGFPGDEQPPGLAAVEGLESYVRWQELWPSGTVPPGLTVEVAALVWRPELGVLDGDWLPTLRSAGGVAELAVLRVRLDADGDGIIDPGGAGTVVPIKPQVSGP